MFKKELLKFIRPEPNSTYNIAKWYQRIEITYKIAGHLGDHKHWHNFQDCVSPMCSCGQEIETTTHFLLHCPNHHCARKALFHNINQVSRAITRENDSTITRMLLFVDNKLDSDTNTILLKSTIEFISLTERLSCPLFEQTLMIQ